MVEQERRAGHVRRVAVDPEFAGPRRLLGADAARRGRRATVAAADRRCAAASATSLPDDRALVEDASATPSSPRHVLQDASWPKNLLVAGTGRNAPARGRVTVNGAGVRTMIMSDGDLVDGSQPL